MPAAPDFPLPRSSRRTLKAPCFLYRMTIFVSHDRMFLRGLGSRVLELGGESGTDRHPTVYPGSYVEYVQKLDMRRLGSIRRCSPDVPSVPEGTYRHDA